MGLVLVNLDDYANGLPNSCNRIPKALGVIVLFYYLFIYYIYFS